MRRSGLQAAGAMLAPALLSLVLLPHPPPAAGQVTRPAGQVNSSDQATEAQPLRISESDSRVVTAKPVSAGSGASNYSDLSRIAVALLIVIGIILLLRSAFRQMTAMGGIGQGGGRGGKMVTVLSRSAVSPRQQVLVLQVGKRLLVVGDSGGRMNSLCEISDPDEIAMMIGQTRAASEAGPERNPRSFTNLFKRANEPFSETDAPALMPENAGKPIDPDEAVSTEEMNGLMDKVRMLQEQFRLKA